MSYSNGKITGNVSIQDIKTALVSSKKDIGGLITDGVATRKINKWAKWKPIPVATDYLNNQMMRMQLDSSYTLQNDVTGGGASMPGFVGKVVDTDAGSGNGFITICGMKLPYFAVANLEACCDAMLAMKDNITTVADYNWPHVWTGGWYRFTDFKNYYNGATFPFDYECVDVIPQGADLVVGVSNHSVTTTSDTLSTTDLRYALDPNYNPDTQGSTYSWKYGVIVKKIPATATASAQYVLVESTDSITENSVEITIPNSSIAGNFSEYDVFFVMVGNIGSAKKIIPLPYSSDFSTHESVHRFVISQYSGNDSLRNFNVSGVSFGYVSSLSASDIVSGINKVVSLSENSSFSGRAPATQQKLLVGITFVNKTDTEQTFTHKYMQFHVQNTTNGSEEDYTMGGAYQYAAYDSTGTPVSTENQGVHNTIRVPGSGSVTLYYYFDNIWFGNNTPGVGITVLQFDVRFVSALDYPTTGFMSHGVFSVQANYPVSPQNDGKVATYSYVQDQGIVVTSYANY